MQLYCTRPNCPKPVNHCADLEQRAALHSLAAQYDETAGTIIANIQRATRGLIAMDDAARIAGAGMLKGLQPDQIYNLAQAAERLTDITGEKVPAAFENLVTAVSLGRERALEASLGIIDLNARYGAQVAKMTDAEKAAARYAIVMERVEAIQARLGPPTDSTADRMDRLRVVVHDLELQLGALIIRIGVGLVGAFNAAMVAIVGTAKIIVTPFALIEQGLNKIGIAGRFWQDTLAAQTEMVDKYSRNMIDNFSAMVASSEELAKAKMNIKGLGDSARAASDDVSKLNKQIQDLIDRASLTPAELIQKQAAEWRRAGADRALIEKWVNVEIQKIRDKEFEELERERMKNNEKIVAASEWLVDKQNKLALSEKDYRIYLLRKEYEERAEILGWTAELHDAFQSEITRIEADALRDKLTLSEKNQRIYLLRKEYEERAKMLGWTAELHAALESEITRIEVDALRERILEENAIRQEALNAEIELQQQTWRDISGMISAVGDSEMQHALETMSSGFRQMENLMLEHYTIMTDQGIEYHTRMREWEELTAREKINIAANTMQTLAGFMFALYVATGKHNKAMFTLFKMYSIAEAIISTYAGAARALKDYPYPFSIAVAALITAAGLARVAAIAAQQPGGTAKAAPSGAAGAGKYAYAAPAPVEGTKTEEKRPQVINVYIEGSVWSENELARALIPALERAIEDRAH